MTTLNESGKSPIENLDYWKNYLQESSLQIPLYFSGKGDGSFSGIMKFKLNQELQKKVEQFTLLHNYSIINLFNALWATLVLRYSDLDNIVIFSSVPVVPLKINISKEAGIDEIITNLSLKFEEGKKHPIPDISKLIEHIYSGLKANVQSGFIAIREVKHLSSELQNLKPYDVILEFTPEDISSFGILYSNRLEAFYLKQMGEHFLSLLEGVILNPETNLFSLPITTPDENERILFEFNKSDLNFDEDITLHELFEEQVKRTPDNIAVVYKDESITYNELNEKANRLGHAIRGHYRTIYKEDILPDTPIGICMDRGVGMIIAIMGILKAGCAYMPIDPAYPSDRLRFMMDDALAPLVVTEIAMLEKLLFLNETDYGVISLDGGWGVISKFSEKNPEPISNSRNLAYIIYTSGSTGRPKGVMIEHRGVVNFVFNEKKTRQINPGDHVLEFSSINFDASVGDIFPALLLGGTLYVAHNEIRKDPEELLRYMNQQSINTMIITPPVLNAIPRENVPSMKTLAVGGDICDRDTLNFWSKGRTLINIYGPTECTVASNECFYKIEESLSTEIGGPNDNTKIYVLDKYLNPVPIGVPGELYIGGVGLSRGYLNRPELTEERFIKNPFITQEEKTHGKNLRLYKSGDRVRWLKNGSIDFMGRVDFQVKIRGFRIEPGEIEAVLSSHGEIKECVVIPYDEGTEKRLVAYYVPAPETSPAITDLKAHLSEILPDYMIPSAFVELAEMPMSPSGKIERKLLPPPTLGLLCAKDKTTVEYVEPQTPHEVLISEILCVIMNLEKISVDSDIFDMGVHSLMAAKIASEIRKKFSKKIELKDIFEHRNIKSLAKFISEITVNEKAELISISRVPKRKNIPLSFQQEQIWFLSKLVPNNRAYNFQFSLSLKGKLDKNILLQFLNEMVIRHEILRTTFHESNQGPVQIVHAPWKVKLNEADLTNFPIDKRTEEVEKLMEKVLSHTFNLSKLPLISWSLFKISEEEHIFLHMEHHFLHDGWEAGIFLREMKAFYIASIQGKPSPLQELPIQYADYAIWQRNNLSGERLEEKISYWINKIKDYPTILNLPTDHPRPSVQSFNGDAIRLNLKRSLYHSLREFSRNNKVTLFNTMYSAFAILISRYSRQSQFLIGTGFANRNLKETEGLMGMFVNTVLLYSDLSNNPTFQELLNTTKERMIYDSAHYDIPFMHIVERIKAGVSPGRNPLFQVLFAFHDSDVPLLDFAGLHGELFEKHNATSKVDMNVICIPRAEQHVAIESAHLETEDLTIVWEYNSDIFKRKTIEGMFEHYVTLLEEIIKAPEKRVEDVNILLQKEKEKIVFGFNDNAVEYDRSLNVVDIFEEQVKLHPDKIAIVHNGIKLSYKKLNEDANKLANKLNKIHQNSSLALSQQNASIGICMERGIDMLVGLLGILKSGSAYVPIPPNYPENRIRFIMKDSALNLILTQDKLIKELPFLVEDGRMVIPLDIETIEKSNFSDKNPGNKISTKDNAYIIYTSGSTGNPKGVTIPQSSVTNFVASIKADVITENDIIAQCANYAFDATIYEFWGALLSGASMVIIDSAKVENLDLLKKEISENKITTAFFTTALFNAIVDCDADIINPLKSVLFGGEAVNIGTVKKLLKVKPSTLNVFHCYGPTECTCYSTYCLLTDNYKESDIMPIGKPLHNYTAYVLDNKANPLPVGVPGELYIGGDSLAIGYLNRPELTAERFLANPFITEDEKKKNRNTRIYKTGDLVRWLPDGNIEFLGRTDFQVKIRGFRIEPEEIEAVLLRHDEVKQCVVIPWNQQLIAYWVPRENSVAREDMKTFLSRQLPEFMVPTAFIKMESFKLNSNFKVDRNKLPTPKLDDIMSSKREYNPPVTSTEVTLAEIWKELLKLDKISISDNFFEIGGNSILTVRMLSSVKRKLGADVNISQMFAQPTISYLAAFIDGTGITSGASENNLSLALKDSEIVVKAENIMLKSAVTPASILITGITGFLGIYLLDSLIESANADIYCLVRGKDMEEIRRRYEETLNLYKKEHLKYHPRVKLVKGNLEEKNLGMDEPTIEMMKEKIDSIYHCGALVHHMYDYNTMRKSNVLSTLELLKIAASGKKKTFNYISTLGVASIRDANGFQVEVDSEDSPISTNGYILSKWVSEKILRNGQGIDINIFRPGNITGDSKKGLCPPEKNHALLVMKGCIQMGAAPDWQRSVEMMPVDILSNAIVKLANSAQGFNIYNISNPLEINWKQYIDIIKSCDFKLELLPVNIWKEKHLAMADEKNAMYPIREFYLRERKDIMTREWKVFSHWNSKEVKEKLQILGIPYPEKYDDYLRLILSYLKEIKFLTN